MSSYLFLLFMEGLISLLSQAKATNQITGNWINESAPQINHLLFAYDSVLVCKVEIAENKRSMNMLETYEKVFGQQIYKLKTSMHFSKNVAVENQQKIKELWGICGSQFQHQYLELPPMVELSSRLSWTLNTQCGKTPRMEREVLVTRRKGGAGQSSGYAISTYTMRYFKLSNSQCTEVKQMMARVLRG